MTDTQVVTTSSAPTPEEELSAQALIDGAADQDDAEPDENDDSPAAKRIRQLIAKGKETATKLSAAEAATIEARKALADISPFLPIVDQIKRGGYADAESFEAAVSKNNLAQIETQEKNAIQAASTAYHDEIRSGVGEATARYNFDLKAREIGIDVREARAAERERALLVRQERADSTRVDTRIADAIKEFPDASPRTLKKLLDANPRINVLEEARELHEDAQKGKTTYQKRKEQQLAEGSPEGKGGGSQPGTVIPTAPDALKDPKGFEAWYAKFHAKK